MRQLSLHMSLNLKVLVSLCGFKLIMKTPAGGSLTLYFVKIKHPQIFPLLPGH